MEQSQKLWGGGKFCNPLDFQASKLNNSLSVDKRLYHEDIIGSLAYAEILCDQKLLTTHELELIKEGFASILNEWKANKIIFKNDDEDVHTVNERRLTELIGEIGKKVHVGRSRNEQVVVDMKLWMKDAVKSLLETIASFLTIIVDKSQKHVNVLMPGYTHLQRAQPIRFSQWLLSYGFFLQSDANRLKDLLKRVDFMPLGSGAIAGNPFHIDRKKLAGLLDFQNITSNSMFAVADRDFVVEFNFVASLISTHLSRFAEDLIIYNTKEFGFVKLSDKYTTGSSLMPQKFNPDCLELIRGLTGSIFGQLTNMIMTLKGLPSTYNKDLQNDKQSMFYVFDQLNLSLVVFSGIVETMEIVAEKCEAALSFDMLATDLAYYLVRKNVPFREAHTISSDVVHFAEKNNLAINEVSVKDLKAISPKFSDNVKDCWNFEKSVEQYTVEGGTSKQSVVKQMVELRKFIVELEMK